jgi:hypothetical protein
VAEHRGMVYRGSVVAGVISARLMIPSKQRNANS